MPRVSNQYGGNHFPKSLDFSIAPPKVNVQTTEALANHQHQTRWYPQHQGQMQGGHPVIWHAKHDIATLKTFQDD